MIEQFEQWLNQYTRELVKYDISIDRIVKTSQSMYVDLISTYYFGRITVYMVNYIDCEVLDMESINQVYYKHFDLSDVQVIIFSELFHEFLVLLAGEATM